MPLSLLVIAAALLGWLGQARADSYTYEVQPGDTLSVLAQRFAVSIAAIQRWNPQGAADPATLQPGTRLVLYLDEAGAAKAQIHKTSTTARKAASAPGKQAAAPGRAAAATRRKPAAAARQRIRYTVLPGDTLWHIGRRYQVTSAQLRAWNPKIDPAELRPGSTVVIHSRVPTRGRRKRCHTVVPGDSLWKLSRRLNVPVRDLRRFNKLNDSAALKPGRLLCYYQDLPEKDSRAVGTCHRGRLLEGEPLHSGPGYHVKQPRDSFGTNELVTMAYSCLSEVSRKHRKGSPMIVGDLSRQKGGGMADHVSHHNGTDIDFGFYYKPGVEVPLDRFIKRPAAIDLARTWTLLRCLLETGEVQYVFMDLQIQRRLHAYARQQRLYPRDDLDTLFECSAGRRQSTVVLHQDNHADHFHVRIFCPRGDLKPGEGGRCQPSAGRKRIIAD